MLVDDVRANVNWKNVDGVCLFLTRHAPSFRPRAQKHGSRKDSRFLQEDSNQRTGCLARMFFAYNTPLHKAAILGLAEAVRVILTNKRVNLFITNGDGETPYQSAIAYSSTEIINMIEDEMPIDALDEPMLTEVSALGP